MQTTTTTTTTTRAPGAAGAPGGARLAARDKRFFSRGVLPRFWHGGRRSVTTYFDNLSIFFPAGERFFVASVRAFASAAKSDALAADIRGFVGQEAMHRREHARYNAALAAHGYPVKEMEARVERLLAFVRRYVPKRWQLAATCALEHFTTLMGRALLSDGRILAGADPEVAAMWRWHAAEEAEHRHVAFELFRDAGGTYLERVGIMLVATAIFWAKVVEQQVRMMAADGTALDAREWWRLVRFLFVEPGGMMSLGGAWLEYFRPGFRPADLDVDALVAAWREAEA